MKDEIGEHYITEDSILSILKLPELVEIRIDITDERVVLTVGPRDFEWKRGNPNLSGAGTMIDPPVPYKD